MDRLDDVLGTVTPLLKRVDQVLASAGAPPDHEIWPALRRVRLLAWDAVQAVAALRPDDLAEAAPELRDDARSYAGVAESLPPPGVWTGDAADAYEQARKHTAAHLSGGADSLEERLEATADLADALIDWMRETRGGLAATLAEVMTSAEALSLTVSSTAAADPPAAREVEAAADVATRVLLVVAERYDAVRELVTSSAALTTPLRV
jgi:methyl-accepting chemotaxis protein